MIHAPEQRCMETVRFPIWHQCEAGLKEGPAFDGAAAPTLVSLLLLAVAKICTVMTVPDSGRKADSFTANTFILA